MFCPVFPNCSQNHPTVMSQRSSKTSVLIKRGINQLLFARTLLESTKIGITNKLIQFLISTNNGVVKDQTLQKAAV